MKKNLSLLVIGLTYCFNLSAINQALIGGIGKPNAYAAFIGPGGMVIPINGLPA